MKSIVMKAFDQYIIYSRLPLTIVTYFELYLFVKLFNREF